MDSCIKRHGAKHYLASKIVSLMLEYKHRNYYEHYFGSGAVLFARPPRGYSEVVTDLDYNLTTFWRVLRDKEMFAEFQRIIQCVPVSQEEFLDSKLNPMPVYSDWENVDRAVKFFVLCRQSMSARMKDFAPLTKNRLRRMMNEQASAWMGAIEGLPEARARLFQVVILNDPAEKTIKSGSHPDTLHYLDPPYLHETRTSTVEYGEYEMTPEQHESMLKLITGPETQGVFFVSGYTSDLYQDYLKDWRLVVFDVKNHSASGDKKQDRQEYLWIKERR